MVTINAEQFRKILQEREPDDIVENIILADDPGPYTTREALSAIERRARAAFALEDHQHLEAIVVGSAKLGFAFLEKPPRNGAGYKPAYRSFAPGESDIDIAIVSPHLYGSIWKDLARFGSKMPRFPWNTKLSPHMLHGWIRPDKFPEVAPQRCKDWKDVVHELCRSKHFRYQRLRCGIYYSRYFLKLYQERGVAMAKQAEQVK